MLKLNKLAVVFATAFSATSAFAAAVTPTDIQNATQLNQAWISGASAPTYNVFLATASKSCFLVGLPKKNKSQR